MSAINDGGPAYPVPAFMNCRNELEWPQTGMTIRDWFAGTTDVSGMKFNGFEQAAKFVGVDMPSESDIVAYVEWNLLVTEKIRYAMADAMLKAREVKP